MKYKPRILADKLKRMVARFPVIIVSGARQVGKSTLLRHELSGWDTVVLDPATDVGNARRDPDLFLDNHPTPLILDEIQYAPELVAAIKRRVDRAHEKPPPNGSARHTTPHRALFVLTGSQQWAVLKSAGESLAGRAVFLDLQGFCLAEIAGTGGTHHWLERYLDDPARFTACDHPRLPARRTMQEQLWRGFLPAADSLEKGWIPDYYRSYLRTYIERDIRLVSDARDQQQFGRFVQLVAALTAQEINHSQLGRELGVTPQTAQRWLANLVATFQWFEIPAFHGNTLKRLSAKPKGYIADTGLACALQSISTWQTLSGHPLVGPLFESAVVGEIRKLSATLATPPNLYHWRSHGGAEVDLLLERDGIFYPIEIKLASHPSTGDTRGIQAFRAAYPALKTAPGLVIGPVEKSQRLSPNDWALPWDTR